MLTYEYILKLVEELEFMNTNIENFKEAFIEKQGLNTSRKYVDEAEHKLLLDKYRTRSGKKEVLENYEVEEDEGYNVRFYTEEEEETSDQELFQYVSLELLEKIDNLEKKQETMKNIMILWFILTVIGIIGVVYLGYRINQYISSVSDLLDKIIR
jgi:hypothetical protein